MIDPITIILLICLSVSIYYNYKFAINLLSVTDSIERCLDILDEKYQNISTILEIPVMYDSPQIRGVIKEIKEAREAILKVANEISVIEETEDGKTEEN